MNVEKRRPSHLFQEWPDASVCREWHVARAQISQEQRQVFLRRIASKDHLDLAQHFKTYVQTSVSYVHRYQIRRRLSVKIPILVEIGPEETTKGSIWNDRSFHHQAQGRDPVREVENLCMDSTEWHTASSEGANRTSYV